MRPSGATCRPIALCYSRKGLRAAPTAHRGAFDRRQNAFSGALITARPPLSPFPDRALATFFGAFFDAVAAFALSSNSLAILRLLFACCPYLALDVGNA